MSRRPLLVAAALVCLTPLAATATPPVQAAQALVSQVGGNRSNVPTVDEWNAVTKEVTVTGSSKLNCETKMVREWLRVSCRGKKQSGGTPTTVTVTKGDQKGDVYTFAASGVTSLVLRFVEGVDLDATFQWTDATHALHVKWPKGAPEPAAKGVFDGV